MYERNDQRTRMTETTQQPKTRRASDECSPQSDRKGPRIRLIYAFAIIVAAILALASLVTMRTVLEADAELERLINDYSVCKDAANDLQIASDYLTAEARMYVVTGKREYLDNYLTEIQVTDRRGRAVDTLHVRFGGSSAIDALQAALDQSNELTQRELYAIRLTADATGLSELPDIIEDVRIDADDDALSNEEKRDLAKDIMLDDEYETYKETIADNVKDCSDVLISSLAQQEEASNRHLQKLLWQLRAIMLALLAIVVFVILSAAFLILRPLSRYTQRIGKSLPLVLDGARELRYLAGAYNTMYEENHQRTLTLKHAAEHDPLTGLCNRGAYDAFMAEHPHDIALLLVDVDKFKEVNDTFGHDMGDGILKRVANALEHGFRDSDIPCRIGGDEFAVIMTNMRPELRGVVARKLESVADSVREPEDDTPGVTLSIGVAFSSELSGDDDIYRAADSALYVVKERGRNGYAFYASK